MPPCDSRELFRIVSREKKTSLISQHCELIEQRQEIKYCIATCCPAATFNWSF